VYLAEKKKENAEKEFRICVAGFRHFQANTVFRTAESDTPGIFVDYFRTTDPMKLSVSVAVFCFVIVGYAAPSRAQTPAFQRLQYPVREGAKQLGYPFAGGLNSGQFSAADLNNDGRQDMVVFDRAGEVLLTFVNNLTNTGADAYRYTPGYAAFFPKLNDYAVLRDYNRDGAMDIFCASHVGQEIQVYRGYFDNNILKFKPFTFNYPNCADCDTRYIFYPDETPGFWNNLPVTPTDLPEFTDVDGDGDIDILTFEASVGGHIYYYENRSMQRGFGDDSLMFELKDRCWGRFYESGLVQCKNSLSPRPDECPDNLQSGDVDARNQRHPGSSVMAFDLEGDGDKDLILGDISFPCLNFMENGGNNQAAWMIRQDTAFPIYDAPVFIPSFPAAFYIDVDLDGKKDMIAAPNITTIAEDQKCAWFYRNTATTPGGHVFSLTTKGLLVNEMIDLGTSTHPAFADVNGDGLTDLVVGNYGSYTLNGNTNGRLTLYLNTGTPSEPQFRLSDSDWLRFSEYNPNDFDFSPAFGDMDNDGDLDLVVGSHGGAVYYYRNTAGTGSPMVLQRDFNPMWQAMDVGGSSAPCIYDLDNDGLNDLLIGERNGNLNFCKNTGTPTEPKFADLPVIANLGGIDTRHGGNIGFCTPIVVTLNGEKMLVTGSQDGRIDVYSNLSASAAPFAVFASNWGNIDEGTRCHPALADLDDDGVLEMVTGNLRGGLSLFKTVLSNPFVVSTAEPSVSPGALRIFPNPATDNMITVERHTEGEANWRLYNALGQVVATGITPTRAFQVSVPQWPSGWYVLEVYGSSGSETAKIIRP
jgi:FG-GAP-like repeat/Secretion system C-terminal sorting domain